LTGQLLPRQPVEVMPRLARHFTPTELARQGLAERDMAIRALGVGRQGTSGHEMARDIRPRPAARGHDLIPAGSAAG
jgi:hypothetical protein